MLYSLNGENITKLAIKCKHMQAKHNIVVLKNMLLALMIECSVNSKEGNGHIGIVFLSLVIGKCIIQYMMLHM